MIPKVPSSPAGPVPTVPDLRSLHDAFSKATTVPDLLQVAQSAGAPYGAGIWLAACTEPRDALYLCGLRPLSETALDRLTADVREALEHRVGALASTWIPRRLARWHKRQETPEERLPLRWEEIELRSAGRHGGLLRVLQASDCGPDGADWQAVETIMWSVAPYLPACAQLALEPVAPVTIPGLHAQEEFIARVEREVDVARQRPMELALVLMEIRVAPDRNSNDLTTAELTALAEVTTGALRRTDVVGRLDDGRFGLLLPMTSQRNALIAVERVVGQLRKHPELSPELECHTGVSGWTFEGASSPELFGQATAALHDARAAGARGAFVFV